MQINILLGYDISISAFLNSIIPHTKNFDIIFLFFSLMGNSLVLWVIIAALLIAMEKQKRIKIFTYSLASFLAASAIFTVIKMLVQRPRPFLNPNVAVISPNITSLCPQDFSFPSGHATVAFAIAVVIAYIDKRLAYPSYIIAFLIALSRIYLQCHYISDIIAGGLLGIIIGALTIQIFNSVWIKKR